MTTCIHTVIKNEPDEYLVPWLNHHSKMVDHIYIFEDIGSHSHKHITDRYENVTLLSVLDMYDDEKQKQKLIDNKAKGGINQRFYIMDGVLKIQALKKYDWLAVLDIDEFITLQEPYKAIPDVLSLYNDKDGVMMQWMNFGASRRIYKPDYQGRDYREFYTEKGEFNEVDAAVKITTKMFLNLNKITKWHLCGLHCIPGNWVNTSGVKNRKEICYDKMYLSHYITKSWEEYLWKVYVRGMHTGNRHRKDIDFFQINPNMDYDECMKIKELILQKYGKQS